MTAVSVMSGKQVREEALRWANILQAAMFRDTLKFINPGKFNVMENPPVDDDGEGGVPVSFEDEENRKALDMFYMSHLRRMLERADALGMRSVLSEILMPQGVRAIERGSLADVTFDELAEELRNLRVPVQRPAFPVGANVVEFRPR